MLRMIPTRALAHGASTSGRAGMGVSIILWGERGVERSGCIRPPPTHPLLPVTAAGLWPLLL